MDKEDRGKFDAGKINEHQLTVQDKKRLQRLKVLIPNLDLSNAWNCHYAALLLLHSSHKKDYRLAHQLAKHAVQLGSRVSRWLFAATLDRWLISQGKKQKFGTQFYYNKRTKLWSILPTDHKITDKERATYGVAPLEELKKKTQI